MARTSPYRRGRSFEYRVRDLLRGQGYFLVRQARSGFPDLVALRRGEILLVECRVDGYVSPDERDRFLRIAEQTGGRAVVARRVGGRIELVGLA